MTQTTAMTSLSASDISETLELNLTVVTRQTEGLSHADSLLQPLPRGNCLNWVLGHIALYREYMLQNLGLPSEFGQDELARYANGSEPILEDSDQILQMDSLLAIINRQQERILAALSSQSDSQLAQPAPRKESKTVAGHVLFLARHEAYHLGQTELLREMAIANG